MAWPAVVPILDEDDICQGALCDEEGRYCPAGWVVKTFDPQVVIRMLWTVGVHSAECNKVLGMVAVELGGKPSKNGRPMEPIAAQADRMHPKKAAQAFNRVMRKLGYCVPCERS